MSEDFKTFIIGNIGTIVNMMMVFLTMLAILQTRAIQRKSEEPVISFSFFAMGNYYRLECENTGKTGIKDLKITLLGQEETINDLHLGNEYNRGLTLYPNEKICHSIGIKQQEDSDIILHLEISYSFCNSNKTVSSFRRDVCFSDFSRDDKETRIINEISKELNEISYSNNRLANYFEGRTLFKFDEISSFPNGSFYEDLKSAVNNQKNSRPKSLEEWAEAYQNKEYKDKRDTARVLLMTEENSK